MTHVLELPAATTEYVSVRVRVDRDETDPTSFGVEMALGSVLPSSPPEELEWSTAEWEAGGPPYRARLLVDSPEPALYGVWVRIDADPEKPVRLAGRVRFV